MLRLMPELRQTQMKMFNKYAAKISIYNMLCRLSETIILNITFLLILKLSECSLNKINQIRISASFSSLMKYLQNY